MYTRSPPLAVVLVFVLLNWCNQIGLGQESTENSDHKNPICNIPKGYTQQSGFIIYYCEILQSNVQAMHLIVDNVKQERESTGRYPTTGVRYVQFSERACELSDNTTSERCASLLIILGPELRQGANVIVCALHGKVNTTHNCNTQLNLESTVEPTNNSQQFGQNNNNSYPANKPNHDTTTTSETQFIESDNTV